MSEVKVNKLSPRSGTTVTIGDSGDTINIVGTLQNNGSALTGDISSVVAGTGLSGGGTSGDVTLNVEAAQSGITSLGTLTSATISGDLTVDTNTLFVDASENTVVVGGTDASSWNANADELVVAGASAGGMTFYNPTQTNIFFADGTSGDDLTRGRIQYVHSGNSLRFGTDTSERMRIDSSGRVMIGTSTADGILKVSDSDNETYLVVKNAKSGGSGEAVLSLKNDVGNWQVKCFTDDSFRIRDNTNAADRFTIDSSGNVLMGLTSLPTSNQGGIAFEQDGIISTSRSSDATLTHHSFFNTNGSVGTIKTAGSSTSYNTSSDYRLKENVSYDFDATTRLKQLKPARFNFIADADKTVDGFIAHEVSTVVPEAISGEKDAVNEDGTPDYQGIDQSKLVPLLVKTIQELEARITTLEADNP
jgi:hypothetical protein